MADLYSDPVSYGINDVRIPDGPRSFGARIYYPSLEGTVRDVAIRPGTYPLIVFAHGDRSFEPQLCPRDDSIDHQRWTSVLHLLAKCGFVVVAPAVPDSTDDAVARIELAIRWLRSQWTHRNVLFRPPVFQLARTAAPAPAGREGRIRPDGLAGSLDPFGNPTPLAIIGHSWGARAAGVIATSGTVSVDAVGSVAGTLDNNQAIDAWRATRKPTLMLLGSEDEQRLTSLKDHWSFLAAPKYQAMLQGVGHWDWMSGPEAIRRCDGGRSACGLGARVAGELILGFCRKHVSNIWYHPPYLLGPAGHRSPVVPLLTSTAECALRVRWDDPVAPIANQRWTRQGERRYGTWTSPVEPW